MYPQLEQHIVSLVPKVDQDLTPFFKALRPISVLNKEYLLHEGAHCEHYYFVLSGCFRMFFVDQKGVDKIVNFGIENWWITDYDSVLRKSLAKVAIQAVQHAEVLSIRKADLDRLSLEIPILNLYFRNVLERVRASDQRRIQYMFSLSGEELYTVFCDHNPEFVQRVPQYMLASYLGFTPEFLSKIRKKRAKERS